MNKIPTLYRRDPEHMASVLREVNPGCEWVLEGEGTATRKYDGTCVMFDGTAWWARREIKPGKTEPANFRPVETDPNTGKTMGWEPIEQSGFARWFAQADRPGSFHPPGTYELCGPKVNGNPEGYPEHRLVSHANAEKLDAPREFDDLKKWLSEFDGEGIVWHHPDGRMVKLKRKDMA